MRMCDSRCGGGRPSAAKSRLQVSESCDVSPGGLEGKDAFLGFCSVPCIVLRAEWRCLLSSKSLSLRRNRRYTNDWNSRMGDKFFESTTGTESKATTAMTFSWIASLLEKCLKEEFVFW